MPRPTMDVNGPAYQEILKQRQLYREYGPLFYPRIKQAMETLDRLEKKAARGWLTGKDYDDFYEVKEIFRVIDAAKAERKEETRENHTTPRYIWRTQGDGKVRPSHAALDGEEFSWDELPPGGKHPGEDYGCRCWAEPVGAEKLEEYVRQAVVSAPADIPPAWTILDYRAHYYNGKGTPVTLHEIGILQQIIDKAKRDIFPEMEERIFAKVEREGAGTYPFRWNDSYSFHTTEFVLGGATVTLNATIHTLDRGAYWEVMGDLDYDFYDRFTDPRDLINRPGEDYNPPGSTPFDITDVWSTRLDAIIKKQTR